jgi:hypothetical protein
MSLTHGETFREYERRHGGNGVQICPGGWWLYPDGASASGDGTSRMEPPTHPYRRLQARLRYYESVQPPSARDQQTIARLKAELDQLAIPAGV